ncbi:MAG: DUF481 domain-containing protein [Acidobacteriota bacterium]|nr:DUF481 domain-containing protein [Acidobacteriota bacterium]
MARALGAAVLLATTLAAAGQAAAHVPDVIVFTNGDQLTGTLEHGAGDTVVFKSDMAGELTIPLAKIKELRVAGNYALLRKSQPLTTQHVLPGSIALKGGAIQLTVPGTPVQTIPVSDIAFLVDGPTYTKQLAAEPGLFHAWKGNVNAGASLVRSTESATTFTVGVSLERAIPTVPYLPARNRTLFNLDETYGRQTQPVIPQTTPPSPDVVTTTSIFHTGAERDEYLSARGFALASLAYDHNYAQGLNLQQVYGFGFGYTLLQTTAQHLEVKGDLHYERQSFQTPANNQNLIGATLGENYLRHLPRKVIFTESATVLPAFNNASAFSANLAAGIALPVYKRLSANFTTLDNYLNDPPAGYKKNSYQFLTTVAYSF